MYNYYVMEIQTNEDGTGSVIPFGFAGSKEAEQKYLEIRSAACDSSVLVHTALWIDNKGNTQEKKPYVHPAQEPGPQE